MVLFPSFCSFCRTASIPDRPLVARYNYTGEEFFVKKKDRGFRHVTSTAKLIIREALPIQCVEAVFVGAYLTADMTEARDYLKKTKDKKKNGVGGRVSSVRYQRFTKN